MNEELVKERQAFAVESLEDIIKRVSAELKKNNADNDFCNKTLMPFQNIKKKIQAENSIPEVAIKLFGINPILGFDTKKIPLLEKLSQRRHYDISLISIIRMNFKCHRLTPAQ